MNHQLYVNFCKYEFCLESIIVLGYVISGVCILVDPYKTNPVKHWPRPITPSDIRTFFGLARYYRRFVEGFSSIATPLTKMT